MATDLEVYLPFDGQDAFEEDWRDMFGTWLPDAVIAGKDLQLQVFADSTGRQTKTRTGVVRLDGVHGKNTSEKILAHTTNASGNPRIDRVVARLDYINQKIELDVLTGTPGASPAAPALTSNASIREFSLAQVGPLASGYATIAAGSVTDERYLQSPYQELQPQIFADTLAAGTATSYTAFASHDAILIAPFALTMLVTCHGHWGFSGNPNTKDLRVQDEAGTNITQNGDDHVTFGPINAAAANDNMRTGVSILGKKDFAAGATVGYRLAYKVDTSNVYINVATLVRFLPKITP